MIPKEYYEDLSYEVRGAAMEVYSTLGPGLLESVYEKALIHELGLRGIQVESQVPVKIMYKDAVVGDDLRIDLLVDDTFILELKSVEELKKYTTNNFVPTCNYSTNPWDGFSILEKATFPKA